MNTIIELFSDQTWRNMTIALLHTLWQGPLLAALLWMVLRSIPVRRSDARYAVAFAALICVLVGGIATWSVLDMEWTSGDTAVASAEVEAGGGGGEAVGGRQETGESEAVLSELNALPQPPLPEWSMAWLTVVWLAGVGLMAGRMAWSVGRLRRIARGAAIVEPSIRRWTEELCQTLGIARRPRIVEAAEGYGPAIFGVIRPVLALPLSMATGLPPEAVRAVLAHELAHLRRYDYWFNLVQMAIESVLFFNPAVWWISRQVRIERESCCDLLAARALGDSTSLAEALSLWGDQAAVGQGAAAFAKTGPRLLLDRVRRLLLPGYRPQVSISPLGMLGMFVGCAAVLTVLFYGTSAAVEIAARILTPRERIEKVEETRRQYAAPKPESQTENNNEKVVVRGTIRTYDNKPLPKDMVMSVLLKDFQLNNISYGSHWATPPKFSVSMPPGVIWLFANREGYVPAVAGPIYGEPGKTYSDVEMVLQKGEPRTVHVVDKDGNPVPQVEITGGRILSGMHFGGFRRQTNDEGDFTVLVPSGDKKWLYSFGFSKPGFQTCQQGNVSLLSDGPTTLVLPRAVPLPCELLSPEGKPVAGVNIRQYMKATANGSSMDMKDGPVLAVTDAEGRFTLDCLEDGAIYYLVAESEIFGRLPIKLEADRPKRLALRFGPLLTVSGVIEGPLDGLCIHDGKPSIYYSQQIRLMRNANSSFGSSIYGTPVVETIDGRQCFTIRGLLPGDVYIRADGDHSVRTTVDAETPRREVTFDLTRTIPPPPPAKRPVILRLITPDGSKPTGSIRVRTTPPTGGSIDRDQRIVTIENGEARFDAYVDGGLGYSPFGLIGYWFDWQKSGGKIDAGEGPLEIDVSLSPAGAVAGRVLDADGKPVERAVTVEIRGYKGPSMPDLFHYGDFTNSPMPVNVDRQGRFWFNPLPLDWTYQVCLRCGHVICYSSAIELNGSAPTAEVALALPRTTSAEGRVLDADGKPLAIPCELSLHTTAYRGGVSNGSSFQTDREGRFHFDDLGVGIGEWFIYFTPQRDYQPLRVELPLDGKPIDARLQRGYVLEGTILDDASGEPVVGIKLTAIPWPPNPADSGSVSCKAEAATDEKGRFRFSNLADMPYWIMAWGGPKLIPHEGADRVTWQTGNLTEVTYRVIIPEWFRRRK